MNEYRGQGTVQGNTDVTLQWADGVGTVHEVVEVGGFDDSALAKTGDMAAGAIGLCLAAVLVFAIMGLLVNRKADRKGAHHE